MEQVDECCLILWRNLCQRHQSSRLCLAELGHGFLRCGGVWCSDRCSCWGRGSSQPGACIEKWTKLGRGGTCNGWARSHCKLVGVAPPQTHAAALQGKGGSASVWHRLFSARQRIGLCQTTSFEQRERPPWELNDSYQDEEWHHEMG